MDTLTVDATYFDTNLARDRRQFAEDCAIRCHRSLEHELEEVDGPNFHEKAATGPQKILMTMHTEYARLTAEQEHLRRWQSCRAALQAVGKTSCSTPHHSDRRSRTQAIARQPAATTGRFEDMGHRAVAV